MHARLEKRPAKKHLVVLLLTALTVGVLLFFRREAVPVRAPEASGDELSEAGRGGERGVLVGSDERSSTHAHRRPSREAPDDACAFFDPWKGLTCSLENAAALVASARPLAPARLGCLPPDWLLMGLVAHCRGVVVLGAEELTSLGAEAANRMPLASALHASPLGPELKAGDFACLLDSLAAAGRSEAETARLWGALLAAAYGEKGSVFGPDAEVLQALRPLLERWPIHSDAWWEGLWGSVAGEPHESFGLPLRLALVELLHERLGEAEWLQRVDKLAALGPSREKLDAMTAFGMGMCLGRFLPEERYVGLLAEPISDALRRAVFLRVPHKFQWPESGHAELSPEVRADLLTLRDDPSFPYRLDLVQRQWRLLGPEVAAAELEVFAFDTDRTAREWHYEAALRIHYALDALRAYGTRSDQDSDAMMATRGTLREWMSTMSTADLRRIAEELRRSFWNTNLKPVAEARRLFADVVGGSELAALPPDVRSILAGE